MPAISNEVPTGYRINGDEMLSFMPTHRRRLAHLVPTGGTALLGRGRAFPHFQSGDPNPGRPLGRSILTVAIGENRKQAKFIQPSFYSGLRRPPGQARGWCEG